MNFTFFSSLANYLRRPECSFARESTAVEGGKTENTWDTCSTVFAYNSQAYRTQVHRPAIMTHRVRSVSLTLFLCRTGKCIMVNVIAED